VDNNANQVVICDKCHCGFHTYCLRPVMVNIPRGDWLCSACSGSSNSVPFEVYKNGINQQDVMSFLGLPYQKATRFFNEHAEAIDLFKEKSKTATKQRALSLQITSKYVTFEVGSIKFIRALENSDWRLPVPLLTKKEWATSLSTIVAAMKYCGMVDYSADLLYPPIGHATEEMNNPDLDVDKIHPMSKRNMEIFKAFNHNIKHGVFPPVRVVYDENMGFNIEALAPIQKYTLVGEYTGDVVTVDRSGTSNSDSLMLLLQTEDPETSLIIDPTQAGNYSRFFSGINNRNLLSKRKANVRTRRFAMDGKIHVALFTSRDVEAGEILSYDYNAGHQGKCVEEWAKAGFYDTSNFF
jgi:[histone H3]-lysine27 N-methyltransferase